MVGPLRGLFNMPLIVPIVIPIVIQMELIIPIVRLKKASLQSLPEIKMKKLHSKKKMVGTLQGLFYISFSSSNSYSNCYIGYELYEKGGTTKERLLAFLEKNVFGKYKNHLTPLNI